MVRKLKVLVYSAISEIELIERRLRMNASDTSRPWLDLFPVSRP